MQNLGESSIGKRKAIIKHTYWQKIYQQDFSNSVVNRDNTPFCVRSKRFTKNEVKPFPPLAVAVRLWVPNGSKVLCFQRDQRGWERKMKLEIPFLRFILNIFIWLRKTNNVRTDSNQVNHKMKCPPKKCWTKSDILGFWCHILMRKNLKQLNL